MQFTKRDDNYCSLETNQHINLGFLMEHGEVAYIYINGHEFTRKDDTLDGLFFGIGDKFYIAPDLYAEAERFLQDCAAEENDGDSYEQHMRFECRQSNFV